MLPHKAVLGENYIVVNYKANSLVKSVWVLWNAKDEFFSARQPNSNARALLKDHARAQPEVIFVADTPGPLPSDARSPKSRMTKAGLPTNPARNRRAG
jgi:hypothetical protein